MDATAARETKNTLFLKNENCTEKSRFRSKLPRFSDQQSSFHHADFIFSWKQKRRFTVSICTKAHDLGQHLKHFGKKVTERTQNTNLPLAPVLLASVNYHVCHSSRQESPNWRYMNEISP